MFGYLASKYSELQGDETPVIAGVGLVRLLDPGSSPRRLFCPLGNLCALFIEPTIGGSRLSWPVRGFISSSSARSSTRHVAKPALNHQEPCTRSLDRVCQEWDFPGDAL